METIFAYLKGNYQWIFSGIGVVLLSGLITFLIKKRKNSLNNTSIVSSNNQVTNIYVGEQSDRASHQENGTIERLKSIVNILFIVKDFLSELFLL